MFLFFSQAPKSEAEVPLSILPAPISNPYYSNQTITPSFIVIHCTGYADPLQVWLDYQVSTHYFIPEQQSESSLLAYEVVKMPLRARHAGVSHWQDKTNLNDYAIGVEIGMRNYAHAGSDHALDFKYFEDFQQKQIQALILLVKGLQEKYNIPAENIIGHSDIAPSRQQDGATTLGKTDPGPTLPWEQLAELGIGRWFDENIPCPESVSHNVSAALAQHYLDRIGYQVDHTNLFDLKTNNTLGAFRLHYMPDCFNRTTGLANACYEQPFDAVTACTMHRLLADGVPQSNASNSSHSLFFTCAAVISGASILLACLILGSMFKSRRNKAADKEGEYVALDDIRSEMPKI